MLVLRIYISNGAVMQSSLPVFISTDISMQATVGRPLVSIGVGLPVSVLLLGACVGFAEGLPDG